MGWIQDIVPNHMVIDYQNKLLMELLSMDGGASMPILRYRMESRYKTIAEDF